MRTGGIRHCGSWLRALVLSKWTFLGSRHIMYGHDCCLFLAQIGQQTMAPLFSSCCVLASLRGGGSLRPQRVRCFWDKLISWQAVSSSQESLALLLGEALERPVPRALICSHERSAPACPKESIWLQIRKDVGGEAPSYWLWRWVMSVMGPGAFSEKMAPWSFQGYWNLGNSPWWLCSIKTLASG